MASRPKRPAVDPASTLFGAAAQKRAAGTGGAPLADRMRPHALADVVGQTRLLAPGSLLTQAIEKDRVRSMVLWGPPGSGKTTLAQVIASATKSHFVPFSAVLGSVGELREIVAAARDRLAFHGQRTLVFVDEIHRFNKAQQDAFLPHVEDGTIVLIGATTENPSFAVNAALLSRCKVFRLEALGVDDLVLLLRRALADSAHGLGARGLTADDDALRAIAQAAGGDARRALSTLDLVADHLGSAGSHVTVEAVAAAESTRTLLYDKSGEEHYNVVSAFIKSMRGSDPDAAVYWMMRMLEAGDDPLFVSRRMLVFASEDVGNADARALLVASAADATLRRVGMPEGIYALAQACTYLASAPKSNASTRRVRPREGAHRAARRAAGADEAPQRGHPADEAGGVRRRLQVRARLRGGRGGRGDVPARRAGGREALRAGGARRGDAHQGAAGEVARGEQGPQAAGAGAKRARRRGETTSRRYGTTFRYAVTASSVSAVQRLPRQRPQRRLELGDRVRVALLLRRLDPRGEPRPRVRGAPHLLEHLPAHQVHRDVARIARAKGLEGGERLVVALERAVLHGQAVPGERVGAAGGGELLQELEALARGGHDAG